MFPLSGFTVGISLVTAAVVLLARASQQRLTPDPAGGAWIGEDHRINSLELYANVLASQLLVVVVVLGIVWLTAVSWGALGTVAHRAEWYLLLGVARGVVLYLGNEASVRVLDYLGIGYSEDLRGALAPDSVFGWGLLLVVVLPVIAVAEELLFRAAFIGGLEASLGVSPWLLVALSSIFFAIGHGIQGAGGVIVTGALGAVLGVAYVLTSSLLLVCVAHYVVNALEFVVNEGMGVEPSVSS